MTVIFKSRLSDSVKVLMEDIQTVMAAPEGSHRKQTCCSERYRGRARAGIGSSSCGVRFTGTAAAGSEETVMQPPSRGQHVEGGSSITHYLSPYDLKVDNSSLTWFISE